VKCNLLLPPSRGTHIWTKAPPSGRRKAS
jgi:hypothetical protein